MTGEVLTWCRPPPPADRRAKYISRVVGPGQIRFGDDMILQIMDKMRLASRRRGVGDNASGETPQGVIGIGAFRRRAGRGGGEPSLFVVAVAK